MFPFERMAKTMGLSEQRLGRRNIFSPSAKIALMVLKAYTGFSDRQLVEHLNGNIHYQMFCGVMIVPSSPVTNYKIVSIIRNEIVSLHPSILCSLIHLICHIMQCDLLF